MIDFFKKETLDLPLFLVGSFAGAYMALLMSGYLPQTKRVISLGGIMSLYTLKSFTTVYEHVVNETNYPEIKITNSNSYYINVYGKYNEYDYPNNCLLCNVIKSDKLLDIGFNSDKHGVRPSYLNLIKFLTCKNKHIDKLIINKNKIYFE